LVPIQNHLVSVYKNKPGVNLNFHKIPIGLNINKTDIPKYCSENSVDMIINAGTAGTISNDLHLLDIFFPIFVLDDKNQAVSLEASKSIIGSAPENWKTGTLFTSRKPVLSTKRKHEIAMNYQADAVDMEAYPLARAYAEESVPFVTLKVISDTADSGTITIFMRNLEKAVEKLSGQLEILINTLINKEGIMQ